MSFLVNRRLLLICFLGLTQSMLVLCRWNVPSEEPVTVEIRINQTEDIVIIQGIVKELQENRITLTYHMKVTKCGSAGSVDTEQTGEKTVKDGVEVILCESKVNVQEGDTLNIRLQINDKGETIKIVNRELIISDGS